MLPRILHDLGIAMITLLLVGMSYRIYHKMPINLWNQEKATMDIKVLSFAQDYGDLEINKTVDRTPVYVDGIYSSEALGTHANSRIEVELTKDGSTFAGSCGYPDGFSGAKVYCLIEKDGKELFRSKILSENDRMDSFNIPGQSGEHLTLIVQTDEPSIRAAHAVWFNLKVGNDPVEER